MNRATKTIVAAIGVILAIAGLAHCIPETLQGNIPTEGLIIQAVCWAFVFGGGLGLYLITFVAGFAHDIEQTVAG